MYLVIGLSEACRVVSTHEAFHMDTPNPRGNGAGTPIGAGREKLSPTSPPASEMYGEKAEVEAERWLQSPKKQRLLTTYWLQLLNKQRLLTTR